VRKLLPTETAGSVCKKTKWAGNRSHDTKCASVGAAAAEQTMNAVLQAELDSVESREQTGGRERSQGSVAVMSR
jgi:hypothetical protein